MFFGGLLFSAALQRVLVVCRWSASSHNVFSFILVFEEGQSNGGGGGGNSSSVGVGGSSGGSLWLIVVGDMPWPTPRAFLLVVYFWHGELRWASFLFW